MVTNLENIQKLVIKLKEEKRKYKELFDKGKKELSENYLEQKAKSIKL